MALLYLPKTVPLGLTSIVQLSPFLALAKRNHRVISCKASKDYHKPRRANAGPRLCKARSYSRARSRPFSALTALAAMSALSPSSVHRLDGTVWEFTNPITPGLIVDNSPR